MKAQELYEWRAQWRRDEATRRYTKDLIKVWGWMFEQYEQNLAPEERPFDYRACVWVPLPKK